MQYPQTWGRHRVHATTLRLFETRLQARKDVGTEQSDSIIKLKCEDQIRLCSHPTDRTHLGMHGSHCAELFAAMREARGDLTRLACMGQIVACLTSAYMHDFSSAQRM